MQFLYHKESGNPTIKIEGEEYKYLFRVRRKKANSFIETRNLKDDKLHVYKVTSIDKKNAICTLAFSEEKTIKPKNKLHIGWCITDPKTVEKTLPMLNEIGINKITFIKCTYSQANFKIKLDRLEKILINSCQQCGRTSLMQIDFSNSIYDFQQKHPQSHLLDFSQNQLECDSKIDTIVVGCEGGISKEERKLFNTEKIVGLNTPQILRSETAVVAIGAKVLV